MTEPGGSPVSEVDRIAKLVADHTLDMVHNGVDFHKALRHYTLGVLMERAEIRRDPTRLDRKLPEEQ